MPSRKHRDYLERARLAGYSAEQAEQALTRVRAEADSEGGYVTDLYERALMRLGMGDPTARGRVDAERILADRGMAGAPPEVREVMAQMLGRMGLTVDDQGRPAPAPSPGAGAGGLDALFGGLAGAMAEPDEQRRAEQIRPQVLEVLADRPGQWLVMAQIGEVSGIGPEEVVALRLALGALAEDGQVEQGPDRYGQGPTWRVRDAGGTAPAPEEDTAARPGSAPSAHFTTFVLTPEASGQDYLIPFLVLAAEDAEDIPRLPLPTSLHRRGNAVMAFSHASLLEELGAVTVSDAWFEAVADYEGGAKIVVVQEPVPRDIATSYAEPATGVGGQDLPRWVAPLLQQELHAVVRDVPVSEGASALSINIDPTAPTTLPAWAERTITPPA